MGALQIEPVHGSSLYGEPNSDCHIFSSFLSFRGNCDGIDFGVLLAVATKNSCNTHVATLLVLKSSMSLNSFPIGSLAFQTLPSNRSFAGASLQHSLSVRTDSGTKALALGNLSKARIIQHPTGCKSSSIVAPLMKVTLGPFGYKGARHVCRRKNVVGSSWTQPSRSPQCGPASFPGLMVVRYAR